MLDEICQLAKKAGNIILQVYNDIQCINVSYKSDNSPVTIADVAAHKLIIQGLKFISPDLPVLSEEEPQQWKERQHWKKYWLVDPLDGTKEFIKRNGEFTVNIALISEGNPILGVIYAPKMNVIYSAFDGIAWKEMYYERKIRIHVRKKNPPCVVVSHSENDSKKLKLYLQSLGKCHTTFIGSSLKFCLIAEGTAQIYPRFGPTNIWDTAAGHAIATAAGANICDWHGNTLDYIPRVSFLNCGFCVSLI